MINTPFVNKALEICFDAHKDQVDAAGMPYVFHPVHIAEQFEDETKSIASLLHDVVEDGNYTFEQLAKVFSPRVIEILSLLTRKKRQTYREYIVALSKDVDAKEIKIKDLEHNTDLMRFMIGFDVNVDAFTKAEKRIESRYKPALAFLRGEDDGYARR